MNILSYKADVTKPIKKADLVDSIANVKAGLGTVAQMAVLFKKIQEDNKPHKKLAYSVKMVYASSPQLKPVRHIATDIKAAAINGIEIMGVIESVVDKFPGTLMPKALTFKQIAILTTIESAGAFLFLAPKFMSMWTRLYGQASVKEKDIDYLTKLEQKELLNSAGYLGGALTAMLVPSKQINEDLKELPDVVPTEDNLNVATEGWVANVTFNIFRFFAEPISNWIFNVGKLYVYFIMNKHQKLKEDKRELELYVIELEARQRNEHNPQIEKEIDSIRTSIEDIEASMMKIVGDT